MEGMLPANKKKAMYSILRVHAVVSLPGTLPKAHYLLQRLHVHFQTPSKSSLLHGYQTVDKSRSCSEFPPLQGLKYISSKDKDAITLFLTTFFLW